MDGYDLYIYSVFMCKLIMVISAITFRIIEHTKINHEFKSYIKNIKNIFEFLFEFMMALLLIYIFNPRSMNFINYETRLLLFLLGIILLITANYGIFFTETKHTILFKKIQSLFGK